VINQFFDLYALSDLHYLFTELRITHIRRSERIREAFESVVEDMYGQVRKVLGRSVSGEYRHTASCEIYYGENPHTQKVCKELDFVAMAKVFLEEDNWYDEYGGPLWAKAAEMMMENPRSVKDKMFWIDRVFDMQHNTGHILNKSRFKVLEQEWNITDMEEHTSALDSRAAGKLLDWELLVSRKVRNLLIPLKLQITEIYGR
jgi:hypothetical protein